MNLLPHRYPFLMVHRVTNRRGDEFGIGIKNVTANEPHLLGHFPANGASRRAADEGMAQTAGVPCLKSMQATSRLRIVYFMTINKARFRKPVVPGDTIEHHTTKINRRKMMWWFQGEAKVNG